MSEGWRRDFRMAGAIAVQAFNKAESVIGTLDSIVRSRGSHNYHLVILQDGCSGSKQTEKYRAALAETSEALESWISINRNHFASVCFDRSDHNNRFCRTAEPLITWTLEKSKSVIFSEDDVIFERDAVEWFERALAYPMVPASEHLGDCWRIEVF
jgi:hypothetical protein